MEHESTISILIKSLIAFAVGYGVYAMHVHIAGGF